MSKIYANFCLLDSAGLRHKQPKYGTNCVILAMTVTILQLKNKKHGSQKNYRALGQKTSIRDLF